MGQDPGPGPRSRPCREPAVPHQAQSPLTAARSSIWRYGQQGAPPDTHPASLLCGEDVLVWFFDAPHTCCRTEQVPPRGSTRPRRCCSPVFVKGLQPLPRPQLRPLEPLGNLKAAGHKPCSLQGLLGCARRCRPWSGARRSYSPVTHYPQPRAGGSRLTSCSAELRSFASSLKPQTICMKAMHSGRQFFSP